MRFPYFAAVLCLALVSAAHAETTSPIAIVHAWARATPSSATSGAVYLTITNHGASDDVLTAVSTPVAAKAELHESIMENGIMKMIPRPNQTIKAGTTLEAKPEGMHIMLSGLAHPLMPGATFPLTVTFSKAGPVETQVTVEKAGSTGPHDMHDMPGMKM